MTRVRRFFLGLLPGLLLVTAGWAQPVPSVISEHYTTAHGLPSNNVMCALRSHDGFLWLGTWYGLSRFDGAKFVVYNQPVNNASDNPPRKIESIAEDAQGWLWLKTVDWKLYRFNPQTEQFHAVYNELKQFARNLQVIKIQCTDEGRILLLTKDKTLLMATTDQKGHFSIRKLVDAQGKTDPQSFQLREDITASTNDYWAYVGRDYRIFTWPKKKGGLQEAMAKDDSRQQQQYERALQMATEAGIEKYQQLYQDHDSLLWVTTVSDGIYCISKPRHAFNVMPLPDNNITGVRCIYQTRQGNIIVGTRSRDVYVYHPDGQLLKSLPYAQYGIGSIYHALEDSQGRLWLSTKGDGLVVGIPDASQPLGYLLTHYRHQASQPTSISGNNVYCTFIDSKKRIWIGTLDGGLNLVVQQADGQLAFYNKRHGFKHYPAYGLYTEVRNITEDQNGRIWVGTIDGLMSLNGDFKRPEDIRFTTYQNTAETAFANNDIYTLHRDHTGQIWVGAFGGGLQRLIYDKQPIRFEPLGIREGLRNDVIYSITEDLHGRLWFATEGGLSCYNQQTGRIRNFDRYDGIPNVTMEETSACCCANGHLWIGTRQGLLIFNPEQLQTSKTDYRTFIVNITADNQPWSGTTAIPYTHEIELEHNQNSVTFEYAALKFQDNSQLSYRYRLEGYDRDWHYAGAHRLASYNEVPPGNYTFVVETIDETRSDLSDASRSAVLPSTARLTLRILPPWWATWWAYLIYLCIAAVVTWLIVRTILQMNRMRNEVYISQRLAKLTTKPNDGDEFIDRLHRIIRKNMANSDFNIDDMANEMGLSRSAFYKKVKGVTGFAPVDLIKEFRLSHASELLQTTNLNITEIAYRSGFKDPSYFGKCFRKRYGMSPREFINQQ